MLTDAKVRNAKPRPKPYKLTDASRLYLLVTPSGDKLWRWNDEYDGKQKSMAFGAYPRVSLADARRNVKRRTPCCARASPLHADLAAVAPETGCLADIAQLILVADHRTDAPRL